MSRRYVFDPVLAGLAAQLKQIQFDIEPDEREEFYHKMMDGRARNLSTFQDGKTYRVRMYIGGKQRFIGATTNGPAAARFADMARLYFWPYRQRDTRPPVLTDMNNTVEDAEFDLAHNAPAKQLLDDIKAHLLSIGAITDTQPDVKRKRERVTVAFRVGEILKAQAEEKDELRKDQAHHFEQLKIAFHYILDELKAMKEKLGTLDKRVDELAHQIKWAPQQPIGEALAQHTPPLATPNLYISTKLPRGEWKQPWYNPETGELKVQDASGHWVLRSLPPCGCQVYEYCEKCNPEEFKHGPK